MRILVVEGDPKVGRFLKRGLETERYVVDVARSRSDGVLRIASKVHDLLILDLGFFGRDALDLLRSFRADGNVTGIIALAGDGEVEDRIRILDNGADDCVAKPFSFAELLARIRALERRLRESFEKVVTVGDLAVDVVRHSASSGDKPIDLTPREYQLLEFLVRNPSVTLTREVLAGRVWGNDFDNGSNVIDLYVSYLRRKLAAAGSACRIRTIRGAGYVFESSLSP